MTMMRMVFEIVMVIAIVAGIVFMMKVTAKDDNFNETLPDNGGDDNNEDSNEGDRKSK